MPSGGSPATPRLLSNMATVMLESVESEADKLDPLLLVVALELEGPWLLLAAVEG